MSLQWLDGAERVVTGKSGGAYVGAPFRVVLHRTEGGSVEGAVSVYRRVDVAPHLTVDIVRRRILQHTPFDQAARSLQNRPGGVETNRQNALQVEIVGYSHDSHNDSDADVAWFGATVLGPLLRAYNIQAVAPQFYAEGCGWVLATPGARQRMSFATWSTFNGVAAHQHVPEQSHWDVGEFKIAVALAAATGAPASPGAVTLAAPSAAQAAPPPPPAPGPLAVDGDWGPATTRALQRALGVTQDGDLGPVSIRALQRALGVPADGQLGPISRKALQARLGVTQDGDWGPATCRALQARLNSGHL